jgi:hypothetical protein
MCKALNTARPWVAFGSFHFNMQSCMIWLDNIVDDGDSDSHNGANDVGCQKAMSKLYVPSPVTDILIC